MSLVHIILKKKNESSDFFEYEACLPDFNKNDNWSTVAVVIINKKGRDYQFRVVGDWVALDIPSSKIFDVDQLQ